jgi:hypothetical protein
MIRLARHLLLLVLCLPGLARAQTDFGVAKIKRTIQTGATTLAPDPSAPFQFNAVSAALGSLSVPGGASATLAYSAVDAVYEVVQDFPTQAEMDAAFPSGQYTFVVVGATVPLTLTGDVYPPAPQLTSGTWNAAGQLVIDPARAFIFDFSPFADYDTAGVGGQVEFTVVSNTDLVVVDQQFFSTEIPPVPTAYTLGAGTLQPGQTYTGVLSYGVETVAVDSQAYGLLLSAYGWSTTFTIVAQGPPSIPTVVTEPQSQTVAPGSTVVFTFAATGSPDPTYQWYLDGVAVPGPAGTQSMLVLSGTSAAQAGTYTCIATNTSGSVPSAAATLAVMATSNPGRLTNLACRADVGTGASILIAGFVVGGAGTTGPQNLLVRGVGPALAGFGATGVLPDPELQLYNTMATLVDSNTGWGINAAAITAADSAVGAFALSPTTSHDTALLESLASGGYTAQVSGASTDTGVALAEIYDATPAGTYTAATPRLTNLSARADVGTGGNILIAGFVIGGSTAKTVLIRASGPALAPYGITGFLPDPKLQLFSGSTVLATNVGWAANAQITAVATAVGAFSWGVAGTADSALLVTLPPGAYTAQISGASGDTGVALVEVYDVP